MVPLEFSVPSLCIATITNMKERGVVQKKAKPTNGNGRGKYSGRISLGSTERKRQILA
jgi:hypothetical protein